MQGRPPATARPAGGRTLQAASLWPIFPGAAIGEGPPPAVGPDLPQGSASGRLQDGQESADALQCEAVAANLIEYHDRVPAQSRSFPARTQPAPAWNARTFVTRRTRELDRGPAGTRQSAGRRGAHRGPALRERGPDRIPRPHRAHRGADHPGHAGAGQDRPAASADAGAAGAQESRARERLCRALLGTRARAAASGG